MFRFRRRRRSLQMFAFVLGAVLDHLSADWSLRSQADRKAAHIGQVGERLWAFDHGLCLNEHPKLRTVLWGWAGQPLTEEEQGQVAAVLGAATDDGPLAELLSRTELDVLRQRCTDLLADPRLPLPPADRYPLPWPLW